MQSPGRTHGPDLSLRRQRRTARLFVCAIIGRDAYEGPSCGHAELRATAKLNRYPGNSLVVASSAILAARALRIWVIT
jgi:hypothetical protein